MSSSVISAGRSRRAGNAWRSGLEAALTGLRNGARAVAKRDYLERRKYAEDPFAYAADICGVRLSRVQEEALDVILAHDRVLLPGGNAVGKTFLDAVVAVWWLDARGALEGESEPERGARVLLPGPDHDTVFETVYAEMLAVAKLAEIRGHQMPGKRSMNSVHWRIREAWNVEAFSPPRHAGQQQAHSVAGRHQLEQIAIIAEGQGVPESVWRAIEGTCKTEGNKIISDTNPTEMSGPFFERSRRNSWRVHHLSALDHENVIERRLALRKAVSVRGVEADIRDSCEDVGAYGDVVPDDQYDDFIYALPGVDGEGPPRDDGFLGAKGSTLRVFRPRKGFGPRVLGRYPRETTSRLFDPAAWDRAVERWLAGADPPEPPDRVGCDPSRGQVDAICAAPAWGPDHITSLTDYREWMASGQAAGAVDLPTTRVGEIRVLPQERGHKIAQELLRRWPRSHWVIEESGGGEEVLDHARDIMGYRDVTGYSPVATVSDALEGELLCANMRAAAYARAAKMVALGLADVPPDPLLREEVMFVRLDFKALRKVDGVKRLAGVLTDKRLVKKALGRSPDRADSFVISLCQPKIDDEDLPAAF